MVVKVGIQNLMRLGDIYWRRFWIAICNVGDSRIQGKIYNSITRGN